MTSLYPAYLAFCDASALKGLDAGSQFRRVRADQCREPLIWRRPDCGVHVGEQGFDAVAVGDAGGEVDDHELQRGDAADEAFEDVVVHDAMSLYLAFCDFTGCEAR